MSNQEDILEVLHGLDPENDEQWTGDGLPRMDQFSEGTTRADVTDVAPKFTRATLDFSLESLSEEDGELETEEDLEEQLLKAEAALLKVEAAIVAAQTEYDKLSARRDRLVEAQIARQKPGHLQTVDEIQLFLARQKEIRLQRAATYIKATEDLNPADIAYGGRAPIDAAMVRKTGYGQDRPIR